MPNCSYEQLIAEHDEIDRQCRALLGAIEAGVRDEGEIATMLGTLRATVADHLAIEEDLVGVYGDTQADAAGGVTADAMADDLASLKADWQEYLHRWSPAAIRADGSTFSIEARAMLARLRARVASESAMLYAALLRNSMISLRAR